MWIKASPNNVTYTKSILWIGLLAVMVIGLIAAGWIYTAAGDVMKHIANTEQTLAIVKNSGSTNTPGWTLTILRDGSGHLSYENVSPRQLFFHPYEDKAYAAGTFNSNQLESLLTQIDDVSSIPDHGCLKSASFGSKTTISYNGKTSGDLSCLSERDEQLFVRLKHIVQQLPIHEQPRQIL